MCIDDLIQPINFWGSCNSIQQNIIVPVVVYTILAGQFVKQILIEDNRKQFISLKKTQFHCVISYLIQIAVFEINRKKIFGRFYAKFSYLSPVVPL